jgi:hypothetical protein
MAVRALAILAGVSGCAGPSQQAPSPDAGAGNGGVAIVGNMPAGSDGQATAWSGARARDERDDQSSIVPLVMIDLDGQNIVKGQAAVGVLTVIDDHDGSLKDLERRDVSLESGVSVEIHGDSSADLAKKSYRIELLDHKQEDHDLPLLGLPPGSDWVLHSCGYDPICLRNVLAYSLAQRFGHYAPRTRFIELFMDGAYQGLYVLTERVRRHDHRVALPKPAATGAAGDITGGYIFRMNLGEGLPTDRTPRDWLSPVSRSVYSYHYPRFDRITSDQKAYLHDHVAQFEAVMRSDRWNDPRGGYRQWLDLNSWVDFALIQELSLNPDAYFKSIYLQKRPRSMGNRIAIGPVWDFDLAFGAVEFRDARNIESWAHTMNRFGGQAVALDPTRKAPYVPEFWERLWTDAGFHHALRCRWQQLRQGPLELQTMHGMIDGWVTRLEMVLARDAALWPDLPKNAWTGGADALKTFLARRMAWMDVNLPGRCTA